ncbi:MAG: TonB-dependent receptor plug domain-containing protein [Flavobacterium sp.]|uniref:M56 family metallopeptidase n=1 Tax=Flavobacterium sp. TaxID=239 RepID=UPI001B020FC6|nr:M56 family metallopeptidase [Flavobacterium sp.]MBO9584547.1 TonB-dependent receptor plug domain-containing protein [Flavobacterium sp.]
MEAVFIYIAKSSSLMLMFYCAYFFLLRKETFFNSNRWFLLSGLVVSVILPLLTYTKVIWINASTDFNSNIQTSLINDAQQESADFNWNYFILGLYGIGLIIFAIKLAIDFYSLNSIIKGKKIKQQADFKFIDINENIAPFSYFEYIVYNSSLYTASELENILEHEKVHSDQNHTLDVLISRIFSIIFWFNPIVWLYKKAITQNLEFIADSEAAKKLLDKKAYQYTLLKITTHENCVAITNHFYQSLIKKRIVMLNKNQSKKRNSWKYYAVIPALAAFVLLFQIEVIAKERQNKNAKAVSKEMESVDVYKITKNSTDADLKELKENLKSIHHIDIKVSDIKRNSENELTSIKVDVINGKDKSQSIQIGDKTIKDFGIIVITDKDGKKKAGIQTTDEKIVVRKKLTLNDNTTKIKNATTNTETHVNTNSITSTKTNSDTSANTSTTVIVNTDNNTKVITTDGGSRVAVSNGAKTNIKISSSLVIVNGEEMPAGFDVKSIPNDNIESVSIFTGTNATGKYGSKAANGVIEIETKN